MLELKVEYLGTYLYANVTSPLLVDNIPESKYMIFNNIGYSYLFKAPSKGGGGGGGPRG